MEEFSQDVERAVQVLEGLDGVPEPVCCQYIINEFLFCFVLNSTCRFYDLIIAICNTDSCDSFYSLFKVILKNIVFKVKINF